MIRVLASFKLVIQCVIFPFVFPITWWFSTFYASLWKQLQWYVAQLYIFVSFVLNSHVGIFKCVWLFAQLDEGHSTLASVIHIRLLFSCWIWVHWHHKPIYSGCCGNGIGFRIYVSLIRMQEEAQQVASRTLFQVMLLKFFTSSDKLCDEGAALHNVLCCSYDGFHCVTRKPLSSTQFCMMKYVFLKTVCLSRRKLCCRRVSRFWNMISLGQLVISY